MKFIFVAALMLLFGFSCTKKEIDTNAPLVEILDWNPMPAAGEVCGSLDSMVFTVLDTDSLVLIVRLSDESGLSEMKIDVHENFDCHGHRNNTRDWLLQQIIPLGGTLFQDKISLYPPANATAGLYHFGIQVTDINGNVADGGLVFNLNLKNSQDTIIPEWGDINPTESSLKSKRGTPIFIEGFLSDNRPLYLGGNAGVELRFRSTQSSNVFRAAEATLMDINSVNSPFKLEWTVPLSLPLGNYELQLRGRDGVGNATALKKYTLEIIP
jgi:hypothetical protein